MNVTNRFQKNQDVLTVLLVVACALLILIGGLNFVGSLRQDLADQAVMSVLSATEQQEQSFDIFLSSDQERLRSVTSYFTEVNSTDEDTIQKILKLYSHVDAYYTVLNLETGAYCYNMSDDLYQMDADTLAFYRSFADSGMRYQYQGLYGPEIIFGYYERFVFADGVQGMFMKSYDSSKVSEEFSLSFYNGQGQGYIVTHDGDILLRSVEKGEVPSSNVFDIARQSGSGSDVEKLVQALYNREKGAVTFGSADNDYIYTYVPLQTVDEWYMISIVPADAVMQEADEIILNSQSTLVIMMIVIAVFLAFILLILRSRKDVRRKDEQLRYQEQLFEIFSTYLANNTDDMYMMINSAVDRVDYVSPNVERILGIPVQDAQKDVHIFAAATYPGRQVTRDDLIMMETGSALEPNMTERVNEKTGEHKWFQETVYCVQLQEQKKYVVYLSDRTKERNAQDTLSEALDMAQVANKAKSAFLGSVSHDIRTPMNAIMGLVTLLRQEADNPERVIEYTQRIDGASQHLLGLINDVLDINKIEGGGATLNITEVNLPDIIDELNTIIRPQAKAKEQTFEIYASPFTYEHLLGDKLRINQILINILSNAVKYTQQGGTIKMSVNEMSQLMEGFCRVQFVIQDNGQGMSEEYLKVIFDPFTREQNAKTHLIQGTGLGMAITKSLVDLMDGEIQVESQLGKGSTFTIELELRVQPKEDDSTFWADCGLKRMIVADDDEEICRNVVHTMRKTGVIIDYATTGTHAIQMMRMARESGHPYNLILLDWKMPDLDGLETARLIRKNNLHQTPIVLFSAYEWSDIQEEALDVGIGHFMPKPFFMYTFKETIKKVLGAQEAPPPVDQLDDVVKDKNILVVDDIEVNRMILTKILDTLGASCDTAVNGQNALERFEKSRPGEYDLIFMDVQMPTMDGYEATRRIRASTHPDASDIAIIAMTANAFVDDVRDALAAGMDAHVSKPIVLNQLKATVQEVFDRKAKGQAS